MSEGDTGDLTGNLTGKVVREVISRGKHLLMHVGDYSIHSHLKMEGARRLHRRGAAWGEPGFEP